MYLKRWSVAYDTVRSVCTETFRLMRDTDVPVAAAALAYTTLLSIIPLLAVSLSIFKAFGGLEHLYGSIEPFIFENLAEGSDERTLQTIRDLIGNIHAGTLGVGGFLGLILTTMTMLSSIEKTINRIWRSTTHRPFFQRVTLYWFFVTLGPLAVSLALGAATSLDLPLAQIFPTGTSFLFVLLLIFFGMYRYVPHRRVNSSAAFIASICTTLGWSLSKFFYSIYIKYFVTYDKIYGGLAALPIFLLWVYIAWWVILSGAALSASIHPLLEKRKLP